MHEPSAQLRTIIETHNPKNTACDAHMAVRRAAQAQPTGTDARKPSLSVIAPSSRLNQHET